MNYDSAYASVLVEAAAPHPAVASPQQSLREATAAEFISAVPTNPTLSLATTHSARSNTFTAGPGRDDFVRYWSLIAKAVKSHPSAFGAELMNEPMSLRRRWMFDTWRACAEAITKCIPDMSVR